MTTVVIGSDHAGFELKNEIIKVLIHKNLQVIDKGAYSIDPVDYPDVAHAVCEDILEYSKQDKTIGILMCGSGIGMSIAANRHPHIRGALCVNENQAHVAREHNDANVLIMGARFIQFRQAMNIIATFLVTPFEGGRHIERLEKLELNL